MLAGRNGLCSSACYASPNRALSTSDPSLGAVDRARSAQPSWRFPTLNGSPISRDGSSVSAEMWSKVPGISPLFQPS